MPKIYPFRYPDIPDEIRDQRQSLLVVGVLGKSQHPDANKMGPFDLLSFYASLDDQLPPPDWSKSNRQTPDDITFYFQPAARNDNNGGGGNSPTSCAVLYMHIVSPDDAATIEHLLDGDDGENDDDDNDTDGRSPLDILSLAAWTRKRSARLLLLAVQMCHIVVVCEPSDTFDTSQLFTYKSVLNLREKLIVPRLPAVLKRWECAGADDDSEDGVLRPPALYEELRERSGGREMRLCSPRFLFYFGATRPGFVGDVKQLEFDVEDKIYKMLRHEFVITNNTAASLFSIPRNKRFVYIDGGGGGVDADDDDPLLDALSMLDEFIEESSRDRRSAGSVDSGGDFDDLRPFKGFAKPLKFYDPPAQPDEPTQSPPQRRSFSNLLREHITEAVDNGFDDSCSKFKGKSQFHIPNSTSWFEMFDILHDLFIVAETSAASTTEPDIDADIDHDDHSNNTNADDPRSIDRNSFAACRLRFKRRLAQQLDHAFNTDRRFFAACAEHGLQVAVDNYLDMLPAHYGRDVHARRVAAAYECLQRFARQPRDAIALRDRLATACEAIWSDGRRQCEVASLRGNPCARAKHDGDGVGGDAEDTHHTSNAMFIAACNCGRVQGRRDDPYTVRQANWEFFQLMAAQCVGCQTLEQIHAPIFQPSVRDFRAAEVVDPKAAKRTAKQAEQSPPTVASSASPDTEGVRIANTSQRMSQQHSLFLDFTAADEGNDVAVDDLLSNPTAASDPLQHDVVIDDRASDSSSGSQEILINCQERVANDSLISAADLSNTSDANVSGGADAMHRQASTTEYLPGMVHTNSPAGLLPLFGSWSLVCIGPSSIYSHNSGLTEHIQSGFLNGSSSLLPWDVHVRLEHAASWAAAYERSRSRRKNNGQTTTAAATAQSSGKRNNATAQQQQRKLHDRPEDKKSPPHVDSQVITLKVFIGCEYECPRGHRFFMASPDRVLRGGTTSLAKDSGNRVVFNDMPLYVPCPCRTQAPQVAAATTATSGSNGASETAAGQTQQRIGQLMRVHIVTPKAPVNVIVDPRVRVGAKGGPVFVMGMAQPPRLTQSSYWILRLPYVYQADEGALRPPTRLESGVPLTTYGCLEAAMFGISEIAGGGADGGAATGVSANDGKD